MNRSAPDQGLLELPRLRIRKRRALPPGAGVWEVFDPDTHQQVGIARETLGPWDNLLRWFVGSRLAPPRVEVCETEDESLVFTIRWPAGHGRQRAEVYDAEDHPVGYLRSEDRLRDGRLWVYDAWERPFAEVRGQPGGWSFALLTPQGQDLGAVTWQAGEEGLVCVSDALADQPIAKMLLVAAALVLATIFAEENH